MVKSFNSRQKFLDELVAKEKKVDSGTLRCLNWNIRNPSLQRAMKQMEWLERNNFDIIVLTEVKLSQGCTYIRDRLSSLGYTTVFPKPENGDYGVILAIKRGFKEIPKISIDFLSYRVAFAVCNFSGIDVLVVGTYIPIWKDEKKKIFLKSFEKLISNEDLKKKFSNWIILGDMNILEPNHSPSYPLYKEYEFFYDSFGKQKFVDAFRFFHPNDKEYSWFSRENNGYRFDHIFVSEKMLSVLKSCFYTHDVRLEKLSDHSAMHLELHSDL
jgi:exodeoxyribonuclease-3